ncbi:MAG TPA: FAD-dependent oxidoreductase [Thermoanaerobaculia bacterium]|nr:FAD-dependent oxidoreductase [Thermoanaerobaculia bacterium]
MTTILRSASPFRERDDRVRGSAGGASETHLAIVGAGPIGLEAALAAAEAGISYVLIEQGDRVAHNVRSWGQVRLFSAWDLDVSPRQRAALSSAGIEVPAGADCPTGTELVERVLEPVARLPGIAQRLRLGTRVAAIGRAGLLKQVEIGTAARAGGRFRLLLDGSEGESVLYARSIFDCTGSYAHPAWIGDGGIPAPGELAAGARIARRLGDLGAGARAEARDWSGQRILLVGAGHSAQTAAVALAALASQEPQTRVHWVLRRERPAIDPDPKDPLPERRRLHEAARSLIEDGGPGLQVHLGATVDRLHEEPDGSLRVAIRRASDGVTGPQEIAVDRILALVGSHGDRGLYAELQVHECYATSGPMRLAAALLGSGSDDCMAQQSPGADLLETSEPSFFILGAKSYGRNSAFLLRLGWEQVAAAIARVGATARNGPESVQPSGV